MEEFGKDVSKSTMNKQKSKNYNKRVQCDRCTKFFRDDYLRIHQMSARCKTEHTIMTVETELIQDVKNVLKKNGFGIYNNHIMKLGIQKNNKIRPRIQPK